MSTDQLPEPWGPILEAKGIHSYRDLGAAIGVAPETARRLVRGDSTSAATVTKAAAALFAGDRSRVYELHGSAHVDYGPWSLPPEASLLDREQRAAVLAIVKAMLPKDVRRVVRDQDRDEDLARAEAGEVARAEFREELESRVVQELLDARSDDEADSHPA